MSSINYLCDVVTNRSSGQLNSAVAVIKFTKQVKQMPLYAHISIRLNRLETELASTLCPMHNQHKTTTTETGNMASQEQVTNRQTRLLAP